MAISSTFSTTNQYVKYRIECTTNWQDIANNISNVTVKVFAWRTNTGYTTYGSGTCYCYFDGETFSQAISPSQGITSSGVYIFSHTKNIKHNADGTKNLSTSAYFEIPGVVSSSSNAASFTLTTIPRTSSVTCNSFYIGDSTTINIGRASDTFTHTVKYVYGTLSGTITNKTSQTSIGWTPTAADFYGQIPNGTTGYGSVTCETYSGDTLIGTSTANFQAYAKESECTPTISGAIVDTNASSIALTGDSSKLIKYLSQPKVTISASPKNSASIKSRRMAWGDGQYSTNATETFTGGVTSPYLSVSATDSRNYSNTVSYDLTSKWVEYVKLAFSSITLSRPESTSSTANMKVSGNYFNGSFGTVKNHFTLKYRYKEEGGTYTNYITVDAPRTNDTFDYSATLNNIDYKKQYIFEFVVEDAAMVVSSGEKALEKGESIFRIGHDYTRTNGRILDSNGTEITNGLSKYKTGGVDIDPNTTIEELILTETNTPTGGFWYVRTMFYSTKTATSNRTQVAYPYAYDSNVRACTYMRTYVAGTGWSEWALTSARCESGWVSITPVANTPTAVYVAFKNKYNKVPNVVTSAGSGAVGTQVLGTATNGITTTGVNIVLTRTNTTPTTVYFQVLEEV